MKVKLGADLIPDENRIVTTNDEGVAVILEKCKYCQKRPIKTGDKLYVCKHGRVTTDAGNVRHNPWLRLFDWRARR